MLNTVIQGDCLEVLKTLADNSVDAIVTDPPAGIGFMGKDWDKDKGGRDKWIAWKEEIARECLRVLKHGGHALVWSLPRTSHWTATAWENAGFEVRDKIAHVFGSGFPKSHNLGKAVDKLQGMKGRVVNFDANKIRHNRKSKKKGGSRILAGGFDSDNGATITKGNSEWEGWGTALKPAREDWFLLKKPNEKGLNIAQNCLKWGVGGLNIDACRIDFQNDDDKQESTAKNQHEKFGTKPMQGNNTYGDYSMIEPKNYNPTGRFPANLIHDGSDEVLELFPITKKGSDKKRNCKSVGSFGMPNDATVEYNDSGNASRFFYCAKPSPNEKHKGCEDMEMKQSVGGGGGIGNYINDKNSASGKYGSEKAPSKNFHPTVKSIALMSYLVRMITPKNGIVLDPFGGSGSTALGCLQEGVNFILIEKETDFVQIANKRIDSFKKQK